VEDEAVDGVAVVAEVELGLWEEDGALALQMGEDVGEALLGGGEGGEDVAGMLTAVVGVGV